MKKKFNAFVKELGRNTQLRTGLIMLVILLVGALGAPVFATHDPTKLYDSIKVAPGVDGFLFGTDTLGRDIFSMILYGAQTSLKIGIVAASISAVVGTLIGGIAGFFGGWVDKVIVEFINIFVMTPSFFLILIIVAIFGSDIRYVMIVIGLTSWPGNARLMRAQAISLRERTFVKAAQAMGESRLSIMFKHIIPNGIFPIVANTTMQISGAILTEAGLSFLGLGDPNVISWGQMISSGKTVMVKCPWISAIPGLFVIFTVLTFFMMGEGLNRFISPKMQNNK